MIELEKRKEEQQEEKSTVKVQAVLAKKFQRDMISAEDQILQNCERVSFAKTALYNYKRAGELVEGASIRLIESIAQIWGNIRYLTQELDRDREKRQSTVEAVAWDVETNAVASRRVIVDHFRQTRKGRFPLEKERDIREKIQNIANRELRECLKAIIPSDIIETAEKRVRTTLKEKYNISEKDKLRLLEKFEQKNIKKNQIEKYLGRKYKSVGMLTYIRLADILENIEKGISEKSEYFPEEKKENKKPTKKKEL